MGRYFVRRILYAIPALLVISFISFLLIQLPPGTFADTVAAEMMESASVNESAIRAIVSATVSISRSCTGLVDFRDSAARRLRRVVHLEPAGGAADVGAPGPDPDPHCQRIPVRMRGFGADRHLLRGAPVFAGRLYRHLDRLPGLAVPSFLLALILMYLGFRYFGHSIGGFFSPDFTRAEWSWARVVDLLSHLWMPMLAVGWPGRRR